MCYMYIQKLNECVCLSVYVMSELSPLVAIVQCPRSATETGGSPAVPPLLHWVGTQAGFHISSLACLQVVRDN